MVEPLEAIFDRLTRAQEHLEAIKGQLLAYYESDPCQMRGQYEPDEDGLTGSGEDTVTMAPLGVRLNTLIGEFLHNLRSALDHLARQLVIQNGGQPRASSRFPIFIETPTTKREGKQAFPNIPGGVSMAARTLIDASITFPLGAGPIGSRG